MEIEDGNDNFTNQETEMKMGKVTFLQITTKLLS